HGSGVSGARRLDARPHRLRVASRDCRVAESDLRHRPSGDVQIYPPAGRRMSGLRNTITWLLASSSMSPNDMIIESGNVIALTNSPTGNRAQKRQPRVMPGCR